MKKKLTSVLLFLAMSVGVVSAQTSKVTGKVVGEDGEPVIRIRQVYETDPLCKPHIHRNRKTS